MAEAHSAVAFSFSITHEGVSLNYDWELLKAIYRGIQRSYKRRAARFKNDIRCGIYPATPASVLFVISIVVGLTLIRCDPSYGFIGWIQSNILGYSTLSLILAALVFSLTAWFLIIQIIRLLIKTVFMYKGWMYERPGNISLPTKLFIAFVRFIGKFDPMLHSFQGALPRLPLPSIDETLNRHLQSMRPLLDDENYSRVEKLTEEFRTTIAPKLQRYLLLKSWLSSNYVSDWWEEFIYLRGRGPIMINSNYYGMDAIFVQPTTNQAARAANITHGVLKFRRLIERQEMKPIMIFGVPLCSSQYERCFNTVRVPGVECDKIKHFDDSQHMVVFHKGVWFKVPVHNGQRLFKPAEFEVIFQKILESKEEPSSLAEKHLAALTAGERIPWAEARHKFFKTGINKISLDAIERSAFVLILDDEVHNYDKEDLSKMDKWAHGSLHGKGYDRWFDKTLNLIVSKNAKASLNGEHSWADAPILGHMFEYALLQETLGSGYTEEGHTLGNADGPLSNAQRLKWDLNPDLVQVIASQMATAQKLIDDVQMSLLIFQEYGKGFMKKSKVSPDAYLQMALQLTYFREQNKFCLTYESCMTRLYREGRTETVRPVTLESCAFVRSVDDPTKTNDERVALLRKASEVHQTAYRNGMCGKGIDRHLFCLYVISRYLELDSPFLKEVIFEPWRLSTSQTPQQQTDLVDMNKNPQYVSAGGGFGPVADDGYGISYIVGGDHTVSFHISSKKSSPVTDSAKFRQGLIQSLRDMKAIFEVPNEEVFSANGTKAH